MAAKIIDLKSTPPTEADMKLWDSDGPMASDVVSLVACRLHKYVVTNLHATEVRWFHIHQTTTVPPDGQKPRINAIPVPPGGAISWDWGKHPLPLSSFSWSSSSTGPTKTISAADLLVTLVYSVVGS